MKNIIITSKKIDSYHELIEDLKKGENILIGNDIEQKKDFLLITVTNIISNEIILLIGVVCEGHGVNPQYAFNEDENEIIVGFNHEVCIISVDTKRIRQQKMNSIFYEFRERRDLGLIIIVCEADMYGVNYGLESVWEICCDLIINYEFLNNCIQIETDSGNYSYSMLNGCKVR